MMYIKKINLEQKIEGVSEMVVIVVLYKKKLNLKLKIGGVIVMVVNVINIKMLFLVQFINEIDFLMKIVLGSVGLSKSNLEFV